MIKEIIKTDNYLLAVDDKQINVGDWFYDDATQVRKAVMGDGLYWAVRNRYKRILAHLPLNDAPILEGIPLLPPLDVEDDYIDDLAKGEVGWYDKNDNRDVDNFIKGYNKAKEKCDEVLKWIDEEIILNPYYKDSPRLKEGASMVKVKIQSLSQPKTPTHFKFDMDCTLVGLALSDSCEIKTITNAQGQQVACGKYV